jgi:hypothetical protein
MTNRPGELQTLEPFAPEPSFDRAPAQEPGFFSSVVNAAMRENLTFSSIVSQNRDTRPFQADPNFNPFKHIEDNSEFADLAPLAFGEEQDRFFDITSQEEFDHLVPFMRAELERTQKAEAGGFVPYAIGGIASFVFDPLSWLPAGGLGKAYQAWRVGSRVTNMSKNALLGSTAAGVHELVAQGTQDFRTPEESMMAIGLGGAATGLLGAFFRKSTMPGERIAHRRTPQTEDEIEGNYLSPNSTDEGVIVPGDPESTARAFDDAGAASRSEGADYLPAERSTTPLDFTSPLGRTIKRGSDFVRRWASRPGAENLDHVRVTAKAYELHHEIAEKLLDTHIATKGTEAGIPKGRNAEVISKQLKGMQVDRTALMQQQHRDMLKEVYAQEGYFTTEFRPKLSRLQFEDELRTFRLMQDPAFEGTTYAPKESLPLTGAQKERFVEHVKRAAQIDEDYYQGFGDLMVKHGLLEEGDLLTNYLPQVYNRDAISADPVAFKRLLARLFMRDADEEWMRAEGYLGEGQDFASLKKSDPDTAREAFAEWQAARIQEMNVRAEAELAEAENVLGFSLRGEKIAKKDVTRSKTVLARKRMAQVREEQKLKGRELSRVRARRDAIQAEYQAIVEAAHAARTTTLTRAKGFVKLADQDAKPGRRIRGPGEVAPDRAQIVAETRAREAARRLSAADARLKQLQGEVDGMGARLDKAERAVKSAEDLQHQAAQFKKEAAAVRKEAAKRVRAAEAQVARVKTAEARTLEQQVDAIYDAIVDAQSAPFGMLPSDVVGASGRVKKRQLNWGNMILDDELKPFLQTEPERLSLLFSEDVSPRIALRSVFGSEDLKTDFDAMAEAFNAAEVAAKAAGDDKLAAKIVKDRSAAVRDLEAIRDRTLGRFRMPDNPNSAILWSGRKLREVNFLRLMGKVMLSSVTDMATGSLATQSGMKFLPRMVRSQGKLLRKVPSHEIRALLVGYENSIYYARTIRTMGLDDVANVERGIGSGTTRRVTGRIDTAAERGLDMMNKLNGMAWWNKRTRVMFGTILMENMRRDFADWASLPARKRNMYLRRQIDEDMGKRILRHFEESGDEVDGIKFPNAERFIKEDPQAYAAMVDTMTSILDESIVVPGTGDLPLVMSNPMGQIILQFQSFAFATVNRYMRPLSQQRDAYAAANAALGIGLGGLGYAARMATLGPDGLDRLEKQATESPQDLFYEAFTRSPLIGPAPIPLDMMTRLVGRGANERLADLGLPKLFPNVSRFQERSAYLIPFGPSIGAAETLWDFTSGAAGLALDKDANSIDAERTARKAVRLMPFTNLGWMTGAMNALDVPGFRPVPKE